MATSSPRADVARLQGDAIGLAPVLFQSIPHMAPAAAVAFSIIFAVTYAGGATPLAVILALVACLTVAISISQLARHLPSAGGLYTYAARGLHPAVGFFVAWEVAYRLGLPRGGRWRELLNTDSTFYGGSDVGNLGSIAADGPPWHEQPQWCAVAGIERGAVFASAAVADGVVYVGAEPPKPDSSALLVKPDSPLKTLSDVPLRLIQTHGVPPPAPIRDLPIGKPPG